MGRLNVSDPFPSPTACSPTAKVTGLIVATRNRGDSLGPGIFELPGDALAVDSSRVSASFSGSSAEASLGVRRVRPRGAWSGDGRKCPEVKEAAIINFDGGGQSPGPVTAACIVKLSDGSVYKEVKRFDQGTHNFAEYHALMLGLRLARKHGARRVVVKGDSRLVVNQVNGDWKTKHPTLQPLRAKACDLLAQFDDWQVKWIPRKENRLADELGRA